MIYLRNKNSRELFKEFSSKHEKFIIKPVNGSLGQGIKIIDIKDYEDINELFEELLLKSQYVCEELIKQKRYLEELHPKSVNSIRVFTYNNGKTIDIICAWLKVGRAGNIVDNGGAGGIVAAIDINYGKVIANAGDESGNEFIEHPDTGIAFKGFCIENWQELLAMVKSAATEYPSVKIIGWDVAHSEDKGWQIIEANSQGQINVIQLSTKRGIRKTVEEKIGWNNYGGR